MENTLSIRFFSAFILGLAMVLSVSFDLFNQPSYVQHPGKHYTRIKPKFVALRKKYRKARMLYLFVMGAVYVLIALCPDIVEVISGDNKPSIIFSANPWWPLVAVSLVVGMQSLAYVKNIEVWCRSWLHRWAKIPEGARDTIDRLKMAGFNFRQYSDCISLRHKEFANVRSEAFSQQGTTLESRWAKICCLLFSLRMSRESDSCMLNGFGPACYDADFFDEYATEYDEITTLHRNLSHSIALYEKVRTGEEKIEADGSETLAESLQKDVDALLERIYTFIACAVRAKQRTESEVNLTLSQLGFSLSVGKEKSIDAEALIVALGFTAAIVIVSVLAGSYIFPNVLDRQQLDKVPYLRIGGAKALLWAFCTITCHGLATWIALSYRQRKIRNGSWLIDDATTKRPFRHYLVAALLGGFCGYLALAVIAVICGSFAFSQTGQPWSPTVALRLLEKIAYNLIWLPLIACTGWFAVQHYDTKFPEKPMPSFLRRGAWQALVMFSIGFLCAWIYTELWHTRYTPDSLVQFTQVRLCFSLFTACIIAIMGGTMGYCFSKSNYDSMFKTLRIDCLHDSLYLPHGTPIFEGEEQVGKTGEWLQLSRRPHCLFVKSLNANGSLESAPFCLDPDKLKEEVVEIDVLAAA